MKNVGAGLCSLKAPGRIAPIWRCTFPGPGQDPPLPFHQTGTHPEHKLEREVAMNTTRTRKFLPVIILVLCQA